jgi:hypothetical protein
MLKEGKAIEEDVFERDGTLQGVICVVHILVRVMIALLMQA